MAQRSHSNGRRGGASCLYLLLSGPPPLSFCVRRHSHYETVPLASDLGSGYRMLRRPPARTLRHTFIGGHAQGAAYVHLLVFRTPGFVACGADPLAHFCLPPQPSPRCGNRLGPAFRRHVSCRRGISWRRFSDRGHSPTPDFQSMSLRQDTAPNYTLHWTGSSRFSLWQCGRRWRLPPASELRR